MSISLRDGILAGRVAFVAGASSGINLGVARGFAEAGPKGALISRSPEKIEAAAQGLRSAGYQAAGVASAGPGCGPRDKAPSGASRRHDGDVVAVSPAVVRILT